jgi:GNAT superfamily N-acetyltransferase
MANRPAPETGQVGAAARIRAARPGDADALAGLTGQLGYPSTPGEIEARLARLAARPESDLVLVSVDTDDRATGWAHVQLRPLLELDATAQLAGLVVDERLRSNGVGAALLAAAEAWATTHGAEVMVVSSRVTRRRAHRFYRRHGYASWKESVWLRKGLR